MAGRYCKLERKRKLELCICILGLVEIRIQQQAEMLQQM